MPPTSADHNESFAALLRDAVHDLDPAAAKRSLKSLVANAWAAAGTQDPNATDAAAVAVRASQELAALAATRSERRRTRREGLGKSFSFLRERPSLTVAIAAGNLAVDQFYDKSAAEERSLIQKSLSIARRHLGTHVAKPISDYAAGTALNQISSIIRCQAILAPPVNRRQQAYSALRAARKAAAISKDDPFCFLAECQAALTCARFESSEQKYYEMVRLAEEKLALARRYPLPLVSLVAAQHYRHTYRPAEAVNAFLESERLENNPRRVLREAHLIGEAALQLWHNSYPPETVAAALQAADRLLNDAIAAGYQTARLYVALASVNAAQGHAATARGLLSRLSRAPSGDWVTVVDAATALIKTGDDEGLASAFLLGIEDSHTWNSLGTYSITFEESPELGERLYRVALRRDPRNAVALTNLARILVERGSPDALQEARSLIGRASHYSDRLFVWWRAVETEYRAKETKPRRRRVGRNSPVFGELSERFRELDAGAATAGARGMAFEEIFVSLLNISFENVIASHEALERQIDAGFVHGMRYFRVEAKWESRPIDAPKINDFGSRLLTAEVGGLFVSMSGYASGAKRAAKRLAESKVVVFLDDTDIRAVFHGRVRIEQLLDRRLDALRKSGDPFGEAAVADGPRSDSPLD